MQKFRLRFEVKFKEFKAVAKAKVLEEVVKVEVPVMVFAKEVPKTKVKVSTELYVELGNASTSPWEGLKGAPR